MAFYDLDKQERANLVAKMKVAILSKFFSFDTR